MQVRQEAAARCSEQSFAHVSAPINKSRARGRSERLRDRRSARIAKLRRATPSDDRRLASRTISKIDASIWLRFSTGYFQSAPIRGAAAVYRSNDKNFARYARAAARRAFGGETAADEPRQMQIVAFALRVVVALVAQRMWLRCSRERAVARLNVYKQFRGLSRLQSSEEIGERIAVYLKTKTK